ncbi:MAG TPA: VCBS repeat-containing protein [Terriglobales bacterium]|nr:VCBS repeat-containing protein [Terriglobales bacterium]
MVKYWTAVPLAALLLALGARPGAAGLSFAAREDFPTGPAPRLAVAAQVNEDDYTDLLVADDGGMSILFGSPIGRLSAPLAVPTDTRTALLAADDLSGDGLADIAFADRYDGRIRLRRGDGTGGFEPWMELEIGGRPALLSSADVDGDHRIDLLSASAESFAVFLNYGDGRFERKAIPLAEPTSGITIADYNGDSRPDVVLLSSERRYLQLLENLGSGRFALQQKVPIQLPAQSVAVIAKAGGSPDFAIADNFGVSLVRQVAAGVFADPERLYQSGATRGLVAGHFDRDADVDLAATDEERGVVLILAGEGESKYRPAGAYDIGEGGTALSNFDLGRGQVPALAVVNRRDSCVTVLRTTKNDALLGAPVYGAGDGPVAGVARDLNADRHLDLIIADEKAGAVLVFLGSGRGRFAQHPPVRTGRGTRAVAVVDLDKDGRADIAAVNTLSNDVAVLAGTGNGTFAAPLLFATGMMPVAVAALDANADGNADLAVANQGSRSVSILHGDGEGRLIEPRNFALPRPPEFVLAGDIDGDGHTDLIVGDQSSDEVSILNGSPTGLGEPHRSEKGERIRPSIAHDFDGDGRIDLAMVDTAHDRIGVLLGSGDNVFDEPAFFPVSRRPSALIGGDFNEDRRPDLVVISTHSRTILLLANTSSDTSSDEVVVPSPPATAPLPAPESAPGATPAAPQAPGKSDDDPWRGRLRDW